MTFLHLLLILKEILELVDWNEGGDSSGIARAEEPGLSNAKEAAEAVPAESVRRTGD